MQEKEAIINICLVQIENSITHVNCSASQACLVMLSNYPSDLIFNLQLTTIKDSYLIELVCVSSQLMCFLIMNDDNKLCT